MLTHSSHVTHFCQIGTEEWRTSQQFVSMETIVLNYFWQTRDLRSQRLLDIQVPRLQPTARSLVQGSLVWDHQICYNKRPRHHHFSTRYSPNAMEWEIHSFRSHIRGSLRFGVEIHAHNSRIHSQKSASNHCFGVDSTILAWNSTSKTKWSLIWLLKEWISIPTALNKTLKTHAEVEFDRNSIPTLIIEPLLINYLQTKNLRTSCPKSYQSDDIDSCSFNRHSPTTSKYWQRPSTRFPVGWTRRIGSSPNPTATRSAARTAPSPLSNWRLKVAKLSQELDNIAEERKEEESLKTQLQVLETRKHPGADPDNGIQKSSRSKGGGGLRGGRLLPPPPPPPYPPLTTRHHC